MKPLFWLGDSRKAIRAFPSDAQRVAGFNLKSIQRGLQPGDFKPMPSIGRGVEELRVWVESGTYRVIYLARLGDGVYVLHAFQKKTQRTSPSDLLIAKRRLQQLLQAKAAAKHS